MKKCFLLLIFLFSIYTNTYSIDNPSFASDKIQESIFETYPRQLGMVGIYTSKHQLIQAFWYYLSGKVSLSQQQAEILIEEVRFHAATCGLNEKYILDNLLQNSLSLADSYKKRISKKWDMERLVGSFLFCAGGSIALIVTSRQWPEKNVPGRKTEIGLRLLPILPIIFGSIGVYKSLTEDPCFQEKYDKYVALKNALEQALLHKRKNITFSNGSMTIDKLFFAAMTGQV